MKQTPMQTVITKFGSKEKLVEALLASVVKREGESKDDLKKRLKTASSSTLLRLHTRSHAPVKSKSAAK